jgi:hypothetical protein
MTAELTARVSSSAEYGGVEVEYVDPGRGRERRLPDVVWRAARGA